MALPTTPRPLIRLVLRAIAVFLAIYAAWQAMLAYQRYQHRQKGADVTAFAEGEVRAPEFPTGMEWLNIDRPLTLRELRGKFVLLDFWTYCCINCIHVIPDLKRLETEFANELVVIGVHSAKFVGERSTDNIRQAIQRYEIMHPVVNDERMQVWQRYAVRAWPTLVLIDPAGKLLAATSGEGVYEPFRKLLAQAIPSFAERGLLQRGPFAVQPVMAQMPDGPLRFPGKVLADGAHDRLFIADSNHHRLLQVRLSDGQVTAAIGTGVAGLDDGTFTAATFRNPQGMALEGESLYVADTDNHAIRVVDLRAHTVTRMAGTGAQAARRVSGGMGKVVPLNSPWDLVVHDGALYIAMAGAHQIWRMDLRTNEIAPFAGSGREDIVDGAHRQAALAQPSGLATDGRALYVADSEVSGVRRVDLDPNGGVSTLIGAGLFDFGDRDGPLAPARLQHPLAVASADGAVYVADTYNNKIKRIDLANGTIETLAGDGEGGLSDGAAAAARFDEPAGLSVAGDILYVADTNNHRLRAIDLRTHVVRTVAIRGLE